MILVTVGTHHQPFDRLLRAVEALSLSEPCIYQTGHSTYRPAGECHAFMPYEQMVQLMQQARVVVCHAGTGSVLSALQAGKCPVVAPRLKQHGEHVDNHQLELLHSLHGLVVPYLPGDDLLACIAQAATLAATRQISPAAGLVTHLQACIKAAAEARK